MAISFFDRHRIAVVVPFIEGLTEEIPILARGNIINTGVIHLLGAEVHTRDELDEGKMHVPVECHELPAHRSLMRVALVCRALLIRVPGGACRA